jgi:hypothetical protein
MKITHKGKTDMKGKPLRVEPEWPPLSVSLHSCPSRASRHLFPRMATREYITTLPEPTYAVDGNQQPDGGSIYNKTRAAMYTYSRRI